MTPLSSLTSSVAATLTDSVGSLGRGGVVIAMSSGLVATMGLPAQAVPGADQGPRSSAPLGSAPEATRAFTAPASASLTFDQASFQAHKAAPHKAKPKAKVKKAAPSEQSGRHSVSSRRSSSSATSTRTSSRASRSSSRSSLTATTSGVRGSSVIAIAARYVGVPYRYGGMSPSGMDCSGYVKYVFSQIGVSLPRTSSGQYGATRRISRSQAQPGDLVFFTSGGHIYHVAIYAGNGQIYDAGRPGLRIQKRAIWSSSAIFGRVVR